MAINIQTEKLFPISDMAALVPGRCPGKPIAFSTIFRWMLRGARATDGRRVKLEGVRLGSKWYVSAEALQRFADALAVPTEGEPPQIRTQASRQRAAKHAAEELKKMGI